MKKVLFAAGLMCLFASCKDADDKGAKEDSPKMDSGKNTTIVYTAIETGDVSRLDSIIAPDIVDHNGGPNGTDVKGRDALKAHLADLHNHFDNLKMEAIAQGSGDGYHFTLAKLSGTTKDNVMGAPAGTNINSTFMDVVKLRDGKATEHWRFVDPNEMMEMMKNMPHGMNMGNKADSSKH